jgi:hypothetical protein
LSGVDFHVSVRINGGDIKKLTAKQCKALMDGIAKMVSASRSAGETESPAKEKS